MCVCVCVCVCVSLSVSLSLSQTEKTDKTRRDREIQRDRETERQRDRQRATWLTKVIIRVLLTGERTTAAILLPFLLEPEAKAPFETHQIRTWSLLKIQKAPKKELSITACECCVRAQACRCVSIAYYRLWALIGGTFEGGILARWRGGG